MRPVGEHGPCGSSGRGVLVTAAQGPRVRKSWPRSHHEACAQEGWAAAQGLHQGGGVRATDLYGGATGNQKTWAGWLTGEPSNIQRSWRVVVYFTLQAQRRVISKDRSPEYSRATPSYTLITKLRGGQPHPAPPHLTLHMLCCWAAQSKPHPCPALMSCPTPCLRSCECQPVGCRAMQLSRHWQDLWELGGCVFS